MKHLNLFIFLMLFAALTIGCSKSDSKIEDSIHQMKSKFPQFKELKNFKLKRAVRNGNENFEIQLYAQPDSVEDPQKYLVFINSKNQTYALPFFSNSYKRYWAFRNEKFDSNDSVVKSTFENEYNIALQKLDLNRIPYISNLVTEELFISILHCRLLSETDSIELLSNIRTNKNPMLKQESLESYFTRTQQMYNELLGRWNYAPDFHIYHANWDQENNRIYDFDSDLISKESTKSRTIFKIYRQDFNSQQKFFKTAN